MADLACQYTLTTPGGVILFNDYGDDRFNEFGPDEYYISDIKGLDGAPLRTPQDNRPQTDGGLIHPFFKGPRHPTFEGSLMIRSTMIQDTKRLIRNQMEKDLREALESIEDVDGTLDWSVSYQIDGTIAHSLTVRCEVPVEFSGIELKTFAFGLVAANPVY